MKQVLNARVVTVPRRFVAVTILSVVVVTAAFGAGEPESDLERVAIEVGYMPILPVAQVMIIDGLGWAAEAGIDMEMVRFQNGPSMVQAAASGSLDVMNVGIGPAMVTRAAGQDIKVVASSIVEQIAFIANEPLAQLFDPAAPADLFAAFEQQNGRKARVATFPAGSVPDTVLRYWLVERLGVGTDAVEIVPMGAAQVQQALLTGSVDGASILEPTLTLVVDRDPTAQVLARADSMFPSQPGAVLGVRESLIATHPEVVATLVQLHVRATEFLLENPQQAAELVADYIGEGLIEARVLQQAIEAPTTNFRADPRLIVESTRQMHDFQLAQGSLAQLVPLDELFDVSFYELAVQ